MAFPFSKNFRPFGFRPRRCLHKRTAFVTILAAGRCASSAISAIIASNASLNGTSKGAVLQVAWPFPIMRRRHALTRFRCALGTLGMPESQSLSRSQKTTKPHSCSDKGSHHDDQDRPGRDLFDNAAHSLANASCMNAGRLEKLISVHFSITISGRTPGRRGSEVSWLDCDKSFDTSINTVGCHVCK